MPGLFLRSVRPGRLGPGLLNGWLILAAALLPWASARADADDRWQPLNFVADRAKVDQVSQLNILDGHVEITKGTIVLRADHVEIRQLPDGAQTATATGGPGGHSYFRQRRDVTPDGEEFIEGEALRIDYDSRSNVVKFIGEAVMRRLQGTRVVDEVTGSTVVYDNAAQTFQVMSGTSSAAPPGRVRGVLTPKVQAPAASQPDDAEAP